MFCQHCHFPQFTIQRPQYITIKVKYGTETWTIGLLYSPDLAPLIDSEAWGTIGNQISKFCQNGCILAVFVNFLPSPLLAFPVLFLFPSFLLPLPSPSLHTSSFSFLRRGEVDMACRQFCSSKSSMLGCSSSVSVLYMHG